MSWDGRCIRGFLCPNSLPHRSPTSGRLTDGLSVVKCSQSTCARSSGAHMGLSIDREEEHASTSLDLAEGQATWFVPASSLVRRPRGGGALGRHILYGLCRKAEAPAHRAASSSEKMRTTSCDASGADNYPERRTLIDDAQPLGDFTSRRISFFRGLLHRKRFSGSVCYGFTYILFRLYLKYILPARAYTVKRLAALRAARAG